MKYQHQVKQTLYLELCIILVGTTNKLFVYNLCFFDDIMRFTSNRLKKSALKVSSLMSYQQTLYDRKLQLNEKTKQRKKYTRRIKRT